MTDLISRQAAIEEIKRCESADSYDFNNGLICAMNAIADIPSAQLKKQASDEIYGMMKDYYFKHRNDHDDSWQGGFAKCMNLIPNTYERREDE